MSSENYDFLTKRIPKRAKNRREARHFGATHTNCTPIATIKKGRREGGRAARRQAWGTARKKAGRAPCQPPRRPRRVDAARTGGRGKAAARKKAGIDSHLQQWERIFAAARTRANRTDLTRRSPKGLRGRGRAGRGERGRADAKSPPPRTGGRGKAARMHPNPQFTNVNTRSQACKSLYYAIHKGKFTAVLLTLRRKFTNVNSQM